MGKKRKVAGEDGDLAKEAAAPKVTILNADAEGFPGINLLFFPGCKAGGEEADHCVGRGAP